MGSNTGTFSVCIASLEVADIVGPVQQTASQRESNYSVKAMVVWRCS